MFTPLAGRQGAGFGAMDEPAERKVHGTPIPRTGGLAIFVVFLLTLTISQFFDTNVSDLLVLDRQAVFFLSGALICFGIGLFERGSLFD